MFAIIDDFELAAATWSVLFVILRKGKSKRQNENNKGKRHTLISHFHKCI